jgi:DNA helicase-2/ATP-dependent DNA helicase PcrA
MLSAGNMNNNKLMIAAAGSGKTTYLMKQALEVKEENALITTYTEANEEEIRKKFIEEEGYIPRNITIQTWFSFLLQHGVRPYQSEMNDELHERKIGFHLTDQPSGTYKGSNGKIYSYGEEKNFFQFYFTSKKDLRIHSDQISKFIVKCDKKVEGEVINRISRIYPHIFIDEVQDLAGWELEILKLLFNTPSNILLVGDPRQVTYLTHHPKKYPKYKNGKIDEFINNECKKDICEIDPKTLRKSHRNNKYICDFSSKLFQEYEPCQPCECKECRDYSVDREGVFLVKKEDVQKYCEKFSPTILRWKGAIFPEWNYGKSKGLTFDRVLIYPTNPIKKWLKNNNESLEPSSRCKFYVAVTRAKYSVGIVYDYNDSDEFEGVEKYSTNVHVKKQEVLEKWI